jgi:hypothetical protein
LNYLDWLEDGLSSMDAGSVGEDEYENEEEA